MGIYTPVYPNGQSISPSILANTYAMTAKIAT